MTPTIAPPNATSNSLGELEGTLGVLLRGLEVGRHLRELRHGERREREGLAAPVARPLEVVDAADHGRDDDSSDMRQ